LRVVTLVRVSGNAAIMVAAALLPVPAYRTSTNGKAAVELTTASISVMHYMSSGWH
jgi:hypothetical protein